MSEPRSLSAESSVLFNLRQLMELEHDRVVAEADAIRAAELAAARERDAYLRVRAEETRRVELETLRLEREREATLLRARLEAEARARTERERLELEHARSLRSLETKAGSTRTAIVMGSLTLAFLGAAAVQAALTAPRIHAAERGANPTHEGAFAEQARELTTLRERIALLTAPASIDPPAAAKAPRARTEPKPRGAVKRPHDPVRATQPQLAGALDSLDSEDRDPLLGL